MMVVVKGKKGWNAEIKIGAKTFKVKDAESAIDVYRQLDEAVRKWYRGCEHRLRTKERAFSEKLETVRRFANDQKKS
jgi:hypothetical protein